VRHRRRCDPAERPHEDNELGHPVEPAWVELGAPVVPEEILARDAVALGQPTAAERARSAADGGKT
jgi:hypothetical protein